jgi:hypothetical protein
VDALLEHVPEQLRAHVRSTAERFTAAEGDWCRALLGKSAEVLAPNLALTVAAIAPTLPYEDVRLLIRLALWLYLLDDRQDDPSATAGELRALERGVGAVLTGEPAPRRDMLLGTLAELRTELFARGAAPVLERWQRSVMAGIAASIEHVLLGRLVSAGRAYAPTVEAYLELAVLHVNYSCFAYPLLSLVRPEPTQAQLATVERALTYGSLAVRLANDLVSRAREAEQDALNVLQLAIWELAPVRQASVRARIDHAVRAHDELVADLPAAPAQALTRSLRISIAAYRTGDLR